MAKKRRYSSEADPTMDRIVQAALECISATSINALSVRTIAATAGVNVATVHYYFRTKDAIVTTALQRFAAGVVGLLDESMLASPDPKEKLAGFLRSYLGMFQANPGIFISFMEVIAGNGGKLPTGEQQAFEAVFLAMIGQAKHKLLGMVREVTGVEDETELTFRTIQLMTSLLHPLLISNLPKSMFGMDFQDPAVRERYVRMVIGKLG